MSIALHSQTTFSGKVVDQKNVGVADANVYIAGSYDGSITDVNGNFSFETTLPLPQNLIVTSLIYESVEFRAEANATNLVIKLRDKINTLDQVIVTAGTMESGDRARVSVLKPLDIVTTAGSAGDIVAALKTLPGTQTVGESGRLFVRGGESDETQTYIDGLRVAQPYNASANNLPTRGRFSPFLFSGIAFSTGGYSAEFGEALSGVLLLNTQSDIDKEQTNIALMTVGLGLSQSKKWEKSAVNFSVGYTDLSAYNAVLPQEVDWNKPYQSLSGEVVYRYNFTNGTLKFYSAFDITRFDLNQQTFNGKRRIGTKNANLYSNLSYKGSLGSGWQLATGFSYGNDNSDTKVEIDKIQSDENAAHFKVKFLKRFSNRVKLNFGGDYFATSFDENYIDGTGDQFSLGFNSGIVAGFAETDISFTDNFAAKIGVRAAHNNLLKEDYISPRISFAYKVSKSSQFSTAFGEFVQAPKQDYLKFSKFADFKNENATHYILNYQYSLDKRILIAEAYYKKYGDLVKYDGNISTSISNFNNDGSGYAQGLDVFWRDNKTVDNLEYWVSYSFIDSKRDFRNYTDKVTPSFVASHSLSIVGKYWIDDLRSQVSLTQSYTSGRPYNDPNNIQFMNERTKDYSSLSFGWAYLLSAQKILYFSMSNVLGTKNVFGYDYDNVRNSSGQYPRMAITPAASRFVFVGFFWTISADKKSNQLNTL